MYCFRQEIYNGALIDNQRSSFYKCGISCRPISHWKGSPMGISCRPPYAVGWHQFCTGRPSEGDFIETNVALEAVLQMA